MRNIFMAAALCAGISLSVGNSWAEEDSTSITIYSKMNPGAVSPHLYRPTIGGYNFSSYNNIPGYAVVRQERDVFLQSERSEVRLDDIAAYIDPTTVAFKSLTDPKQTTVLEQNYMFDLVSIQKLAERYLGQNISYEKRLVDNMAPEVVSGILLSVQNNQLTVQNEDGSIVSVYPQNAIFPKLPGKLFTKPTLIWDVVTKTTGKHRIEASYQTEGITWWADYNAVYQEGENANKGYLDLGAWVSIVNKSGASYDDAKLKLIAGDVNRAKPQYNRGYAHKTRALAAEADSVAGFAEKAFFEFHLYTLGRPTTIADNATKQVELFPKATQVPVDKLLVYYGSQNYGFYGGTNYNQDYGNQSNKKVDVYLEFKNEKENGLGIPLPAGRLRVSKLDTDDGSLEFIGEDTIGHTPKDEKLLIKLGSAFDVVGERKQTDFFVDRARRMMEEEFEIKIRNHKDQAVDVIVKENLYRAANWKIIETSMPYEKINSNTIHFKPNVPKDGEEIIRYKVQYNWR